MQGKTGSKEENKEREKEGGVQDKKQDKKERRDRQEKEFLTRWTSSLMRAHKRIKHETQILGHFLFVIYASLNQGKPEERY